MADSSNKLLQLGSIVILILFASGAESQTCKSYQFANNKLFQTCADLPFLNAFLHWTYNSSSNSVQLAYRSTRYASSKWVAWALNPEKTGMSGAQTLVAYQQADGILKAYTSPIDGYSTDMAEGKLSFPVSDLSAVAVGKEITIFATVGLPGGRTTLVQVWQEGPMSGGSPAQHESSPANLGSKGSINFLSGQAAPSGGGDSKINKRKVHGVLNMVSWGALMPLGMITARYLKVFRSADPAWFYLHAGCQTTAYILGVSGWATGLKLGTESKGIHHKTHGNMGITLFCLGTLQVFALLLRPNKEHKYRFFWNIYHHSVGYLVILLSTINIFQGLNILGVLKWKKAYTGVLIALVVVALFLEAFTWYIVVKNKKKAMITTAKMQQEMNGVNNGRPNA
uniref:Cytochrome b561 and DOMON domain-containing protein n=1 Tax=Kalanchoe fedtschenkoi TaxID=63787 RepID=A0A7N0VHK9_KALFE